MVSAYWSSIKARGVEISGGMGDMCITMGTAEAIAMRMIATAKIFAMSSCLWPPSGRSCLGYSPQPFQAAANRYSVGFVQHQSYLFRLEREIGTPSAARGDGYLFSLRTCGLVPCGNGVASGRHVADGVSALRVRGPIGAFYHDKPAMHPGMDIALDWNHFRSFPALFNR